MKDNLEILSFFSNPDSQQSQVMINDIIEISYNIAVKYLQSHKKKIINLLLRNELTIQELPIDSIADLFVKDDDKNLNTLMHSFHSWRPEIITEEDALFFLNKIVASRVEQHIFKLLKDEDPFFSKLLDSINYLIKQNGYHKFHFLGKTFITEVNFENFEKEFISTDEFEKLPSNLFNQKKFLLTNLLNYLRLETNFNAAIPLNDLIYRLKYINFSDYLISGSNSSVSNKTEMDEFVDIGSRVASDKLNSTYFLKNKINLKEKTALENALKEMVVDLCNGGISPGLYEYLSPHIPNLSEGDYKAKYHNILEYLLKVMKSTIASTLKEKN